MLGKASFRVGSLAFVFSLVQRADINLEFFQMHLCGFPDGHTKWDSCLFKLFHQDTHIKILYSENA
jgi:hypothetical protein